MDKLEARKIFKRDGFLSPVQILSEQEIDAALGALTSSEQIYGPLHYISKVHTILNCAFELARNDLVLDVVENLIGPDILLFDVTYIIKEPRTNDHVSWHQDLTYWGFDGEDQVSMWLALTPATAESGAMRMIPGSHLFGRHSHTDTNDPDNVLHRGQTVSEIDESAARLLPLQPGEASFHHGWTLHASRANKSNQRRIGLNVQFLKPSMRQTVNPTETAILLRGKDRFGYFQEDQPAEKDLDPAALVRHREIDRLRKEIWDQAG